jgi:hypothetical protein
LEPPEQAKIITSLPPTQHVSAIAFSLVFEPGFDILFAGALTHGLHLAIHHTAGVRNTMPSSSYFTLARGGYVLKISLTEMGGVGGAHRKAVDEILDLRKQPAAPTPTNMATKIHNLRNRSRKPSFWLAESVTRPL